MKFLKVFGILFLGFLFMNSLNNKSDTVDLSKKTVVEINKSTSIVDFLMEDNFCWKETYGRGIGSIPTVCSNGMELDAGLCYKLCKSGYHGIGPVCWGNCPPDFRDDGAFCYKPKPYDRPQYPWIIGDQVGSDTKMWQRCEDANGKGNCVKEGLIVYAKCKEGFNKAGCCLCSPACPEGFADAGVSCTKPSYGRGVGVVPNGCTNGGEYDAGLCYTKCNPGYTGIGPVCWEVTCPKVNGKQWVDCGAGCATSDNDCATAIVDMTTTPLIAILNIAGLILSGGTSSGATVGAGAATGGAAAASAGATAAATFTTNAGQIVTYATQAVETIGSVSQAIIESDLIAVAQQQLNGRPIPEHQKKGLKLAADMVYDADRTTSFDWKVFANLDPTGVANIAAAYANPLCKDIASGTSTPIANTMAPASAGYVRIQNKANKQNYIHNQNGKLEQGVIQPNWWSSQWKVIPADGGYVRIQNKWKTDQYLHNQNGKIESGPMQANWWSAQWKIIPVNNGWVRIQNKWKSDQYLHNQNGTIEVGPIDNNSESALWMVK